MMITKQQIWSLAALCVGRRSDFALQQADGRYLRTGRPLDYSALRLHLSGELTIGTYVTDEQGCCHFAVFDADSPDGLFTLLEVQRALAAVAIPSYLELSRRGGHLWVFLSRPASAASLRSWLQPFCPAGVEFYPKRDWATDAQPGSLIRLPFGVHRLSGRRYPFVSLSGDRLVPVASSVAGALTWLSTVERVIVPNELLSEERDPARQAHTHIDSKKSQGSLIPDSKLTIREWCAQQDFSTLISRYVCLDDRGLGCCPFGWHHSDGKDTHPSFEVYAPVVPGGYCWRCYVWGQGGTVFDFLVLYHGLSVKELWHRILSGEQF